MEWRIPPKIKIYEALGTIADGRIKISGNIAKVYSSSGKKFYDVIFDPATNSVTANDNGSYWQGYLGYPAIAFLIEKGLLPSANNIAHYFKNVAWKDINTAYKNDFARTEEFVREKAEKEGGSLTKLDDFLSATLTAIEDLKLKKLGATAKPPKGY